MITTFHCPKCSRLLTVSGTIDDPDRGSCSVFQCDECLVVVIMFGEPVEIAYTFAVDSTGQPFDPAEGSSFG